MGHDKFGLWTEISIGEARQRLRWIAPGKSLMGSPESEQGRLNSEGPQHEVTISKGFWLFDTACTQALWQAVMENNRNHFKGQDRPVETVSWDNAQDFLRLINERIPGLGLSLPSEAQWEYACRAGTTTPFSCGENITTDQVNYDGRYPYAGGPQGVYRAETVPVASLPANSWGVYEMHGNVWEWCADAWHAGYKGAPSDGSVWDEKKAAGHVLSGGSWLTEAGHHVLRGGSCCTEARYVRSASRFWAALAVRKDQFVGFRCARF